MDLKELFKKSVVESLIISVLGGSLAGFISGEIISRQQNKRLTGEQESSILFADEQNFGVACIHLKAITNTDMPVVQYVTDTYFTNAHIITAKSEKTRELIQQNIVQMRASNSMLDKFFDMNLEIMKTPLPKLNAEATRIKENIKKMATEIIERVGQYNAELSALKCQ